MSNPHSIRHGDATSLCRMLCGIDVRRATTENTVRGGLWRAVVLDTKKKPDERRRVLSIDEVMFFDLKNDARGRRTILVAIGEAAGKVLELLKPALRALHAESMLKVGVRPRDGLARLQAVGMLGAATAVCLRMHSHANRAQQQHVWCAFACRVRRAVWSLVYDRVRLSLGGFA